MKIEKTRTNLLSRRDFLKLSGLNLAGVSFIKIPFNNLLSFASSDHEWNSKFESFVNTVCQLCPGSCGLRVRVIDQIPISVAGNPYHPVNAGSLCPKGLSALQSYYHPSRIESPMIKQNDKFNPISWEAAFKVVGDELSRIRKNGYPQEFTFFHENLHGVSYDVACLFSHLYDTPNFLDLDGNKSVYLANSLCLGSPQLYAFDIENSNFILSFGARLLDAGDCPLYFQRAISDMRVKRQDAQLIQVESRCSTTAARSNEWVPINPGAEGALALGIAYVIIKEKLYNENFVEKYTDGFETVTTSSGATEPGFKHFIIENYHPYQMSKITGVSVEKIIMLAKLITRMKPAVAVYDQTLTQYSNGIDNILAVNALNALIGSIDNPGGILKQRKLPESETDGKFSQSKNTKFNSFNLNDEFTFEGGKNNMQVLFIYNSNPVYNSADHKKFLQWMKKIPLTVSFSTIWDETAEASTLVLPEHHFLEKLEDVPASKAFPYPVNGLSQPVTQKPLYDTNHFIDILTGIALKTGEPLISQFSGFSSDMLVKNYFEKVYTSKRGTIFTNKFDTAQVRTMEERGWWTDFHKSFPAFWDELKKQGGWWDPTYTNGEWGRIFSTQTRKYEFFPKNPDIRMTFPHYEKTIFSSQSANYPFYLNVFEPLSFSGGTGGDLPWALENPASSISTFWEAWVEINPETAKSLNISDGDQVFVESASGRIQATAKYFPASKPDVISMPSGFGRKSFCPEIPSAGSNVLNILCSNKQRFSTKPALLSTMVKVYKI